MYITKIELLAPAPGARALASNTCIAGCSTA